MIPFSKCQQSIYFPKGESKTREMEAPPRMDRRTARPERRTRCESGQCRRQTQLLKSIGGLTLSGEGFLEEETPAEPRSVDRLPLQIREHTLVTGFREKNGLEPNRGHLWNSLHFRHHYPGPSRHHFSPGQLQKPSSYVPLLLLCNTFCTRESESKSKLIIPDS